MSRPPRVLHVVGGLDPGGTEAWLTELALGIDRRRVTLDFLVHSAAEGALEPAVCEAGCTVLRALSPHNPVLYARRFRRILRERGPYAAVHTHMHDFSGFVLRLAAQADVELLIAHAHTDTAAVDARASWLRRSYQRLGRSWIQRYATHGFAVSSGAARTSFGRDWRTDPRFEFLPCGIDPAIFEATLDSAAVRHSLGLPIDAPVLGHVGRFVGLKNHTFLVDVAAEAMRRDPALHLLLVGDGPLRAQTAVRIVERGIGARSVLTGNRSDVPALMRAAMDALVFPSLVEGLPRVILEAQASGLPVVCSDRVPEESVLAPRLVQRFSLGDPIEQWARIAGDAARAARRERPQPAEFTGTAFDLAVGRERLVRLYESAQGRV